MEARNLPALPAFSAPGSASGAAPARALALPVPELSKFSSGTEAAGAPAADTVDPKFRRKAEEAAVKFEAFFITQMLRGMRRSAREIAPEDGAYRSQINDDMLDMADVQLADKLATLRSFGIADALLKQILRSPADLPASGQK